MLTVAEAWDAIHRTVSRGPMDTVSIEAALGFVLAEPLISDIDSPPFDKALMDGFAVRTADLAGGNSLFELQVIEEITAGQMPTRRLQAGQAARIMTGAPIPDGADAVIPVEECEFEADEGTSSLGRVVIRAAAPPAVERFILRRGAAVRRGATVMTAGRSLRAQEIAAFAELGRPRVQVIRRPRVAILATGNELVPARERPGPGQIRNSNEPMLAAQIEQLGAEPVRLGIAKDERTALRKRIEAGLACDFLLLSGGVSAGKLDLVPSELVAAGVRKVFHKIQMKPGKPLWFGVREGDGEQPPCFVFGLPGNPVSSMVCCELFVRAAVRRWTGLERVLPEPVSVPLAAAVTNSCDRPTYHPAHLAWSARGPLVSLVDWIGSSDLCATVNANCTALLPAGEHQWAAGDRLDVFLWD